MQSYTLPAALTPGTTYYWRVVGKTMANLSRTSDVWNFTTAGTAPPPPASGSAGAGDVVLYAAEAAVKTGTWTVVTDGSAAGGARMANPNLNAAKITTASATPSNYFEMTFSAEAGKPYQLWMRGKAESDSYPNDSVFVQFSDSVTAGGAEQWRIGTTSAAEVNLENCSGCGVAGWGWQDTGYGNGVPGAPCLLCDDGRAQAARADPRGRLLDRSDRALEGTFPLNVAWCAEERHDDPGQAGRFDDSAPDPTATATAATATAAAATTAADR